MNKKICIPISFFNTFYDGSKYPGNPEFRGLERGANCQYFTYELLKYFGYQIPNLRSSELWSDKKFTRKVKRIQPLDIVLFNKSSKAYGSHIGLCIGNNKVLHLCKEVGYPTVWDLKDFNKRNRYKVFVGTKRPQQKTE